MDSALSRLQRELLDAFFEREQRFFLTGGAALAGFYLGHRTTEDLDLFTTTALLDDGETSLVEAAKQVGGTIERVQTAPHFRRRLVRRGDEAVIVDLVFDSAPQLHSEKQRIGEVRLDSPDEIQVNKLCALLSRAELRDLVDALTLDRAGYSIEEAARHAAIKEGGFSPAQLAWVLSEVRIGDDASVPAGWSPRELRDGLEQLRARLARMAFPG